MLIFFDQLLDDFCITDFTSMVILCHQIETNASLLKRPQETLFTCMDESLIQISTITIAPMGDCHYLKYSILGLHVSHGI